MEKKKRTNRQKREIAEAIAMIALWLMIIAAMSSWVFGPEVFRITKPLGIGSLAVFLAAAWKAGVFCR